VSASPERAGDGSPAFCFLIIATLHWRYFLSVGKAAGACFANSFRRASISFTTGIPE
jgi:hypothetical protein